MKAMTFNIRYGRAEDGPHAWPQRRARVIERIRAFDPDLLALQECEDGPQAQYVKSALPDYAFIGYRREGGGNTAAEMAPVLYKRAAFEQVAAGRFWLSETPDTVGSKSWGAMFARTLTWVHLRPRGSAESLIFASTHFDLIPEAIEAAAQLVAGWASEAARQAPVMVCGDFNAEKGSTAYATLTSGALRDAAPQLLEGTYHDYGRATPRTSIDWVLVSGGLDIASSGIDAYARDGLYPSDHFSVWVRW